MWDLASEKLERYRSMSCLMRLILVEGESILVVRVSLHDVIAASRSATDGPGSSVSPGEVCLQADGFTRGRAPKMAAPGQKRERLTEGWVDLGFLRDMQIEGTNLSGGLMQSPLCRGVNLGR